MNHFQRLDLAMKTILIVISGLATALGGEEKPLRTVKISAYGAMKVVPDQVVLTLAVVTENKDLLLAKSDNDAKTRKILDLADKYHLKETSFQIDQMSISPEFSRSSRESVSEFVGYSVNRQIVITLTDFAIMEPIISDSLSLGANRMSELLFRTTKIREYQFETRKKAVEVAKEKAGHLSELNGLKLGKAISIEEEVEGSRNTEVMACMAPSVTSILPTTNNSGVSPF